MSDQVERAQDQRELIPAGEKPTGLAFPAPRPARLSGRTPWRSALRSDRPKQPESAPVAPREVVCLPPSNGERLPLPKCFGVVGPTAPQRGILNGEWIAEAKRLDGFKSRHLDFKRETARRTNFVTSCFSFVLNALRPICSSANAIQPRSARPRNVWR